jgi:enoyl-CoA hydratase/carnithine racemase
MSFETILVEQLGPVTLVRLNRPQALNRFRPYARGRDLC